MKHIKSTAAFLCCFAVILSLFGCAEKAGAPDASETQEPVQTVVSDEKINSISTELLGIEKKSTFVLNESNIGRYGYAEFKGHCEGIYVSDILESSPLLSTGFRRGDIIMAINGKRTPSYIALYNALSPLEPGSEAVVSVFRYNLISGEAGSLSFKFTVPSGEAVSAAETTTEAVG